MVAPVAEGPGFNPAQNWGAGISDLLGLGGSIYGLANTGSSQVPNVWTPGMGAQSQPFNQQADLMGQYYGAATQYPVQNYPAQNYGGFQQQTQNLINNPYGQIALGGAGMVAGQAPMYAGYNAQGAGQLAGMGGYAAPYAQQILQTGFDPQQQLYARTLQQVQDQTQAAQNRTGVGASPYGAGLMGQTLSNFNIDWQNAQLGRQNQAAQGYGALVSGAGNAYSGANNLWAGANQNTLAATAAPYNSYAGQIGNNLAALQQLNTAGQATWQLPQNAFNNAGALIGNQAQQVGAGNTAAGLNFNQQQAYGRGIGQSLGGLAGGIFGGPLGGTVGGIAGGILDSAVDWISDLF